MDVPLRYATAQFDWLPLEESDIDVIYRQFSDPDMCRYFSEPPCSVAEAAEIIRMYQHTNGRRMRWKLIHRTTNEFIGTCGYHYYNPHKRHVELGYDIWKAFWNHGYMREVLPALISLCADCLDIDTIYVYIDENNAASLAVAQRAGFVASPPFRPFDSPNEVCLAYQITPRSA